jgi:redox-sensitive bicupin YhaK (pirin superfamily)
MLKVRRAEDRGHADHGWLNSYHTFSFAGYYDPANTGFRSLRVINEDFVLPGQGFGAHPHRDMEILTYVLEGALEHRDSMGNGGVIRLGEVQRMSAGSGITHSEFNASDEKPVHFVQVWILPEQRGITPSYEQRSFDLATNGKLQLIASPDADENSMAIHQDAKVYAGKLEAGANLRHEIAKDRHAWVQVARGEVEVNGTKLRAGDGAAITGEPELRISTNGQGSELLLFDLR